ncbi:MAG TPA: hypothetical protein VKU62_06540 [Thermoanaerobaculia bacterium]|nr:hypothetical protein [Thermoanaerobaculia bacterium]
MFRRTAVLLVMALAPVVAFAAAGTAKGTITINGKAKDLKYAYAWKDGANTTILLSTEKVDESAFGDHFALTKLAKDDKFAGVQATITPKGEVSTGTIYTAAEDGYFDAVGMHDWKKSKQTPTEIAGKLSTGDHKFFKTAWTYSADFTAPIGPPPKKK